jgi:hypothetical protein
VSKGGAETTALVHTVDIFATVAEIAGVDVNKLGRPIDGVSFLPHITDPGRASTRDTVYTAKHLPNGMGPYEESSAMIRDQQFKLVVDHTDGTEAERLYELQNGSGPEGPNLLRGKKGVPPNAQRAYEKLKAELKRIEGSLRPDPIDQGLVPHEDSAAALAYREADVFELGAHAALEPRIPHCVASTSSRSTTIRTALSRTSWENLVLRVITPSISTNGVSGKSGAVQSRDCSAKTH